MTTLKSLPARPSQQSLRKQARKLARDIAAGSAAGIARARAQLPNAELPLTQRDAQVVLAREYGYAGWQDLSAEVAKRLGKGLEWAADQAERAIHDNDIERLRQLLSEYPALLSWGLEYGGLVGRAVHSYGDSSDPDRERVFTRRECAEFLINAGATVVPWLADNILNSRAGGLIRLFSAKGLLPRTLKFLVALSDEDGVRACFDRRGVLRPGAGRSSAEREIVNEAFLTACTFKQESIAAFLLERTIALCPELGSRIDSWRNRSAFVEYMCKNGIGSTGPHGTRIVPWRAFLRDRLMRTINEGDVSEFKRLLRAEPDLIGESNLRFEVELVEYSVLKNRPEFIECLFELDPGLLEHRPPPVSCALDWAFTYVKTHLVPILTRVWPLPDDLPHAAGIGDFENVKKWFDASGAPSLGDPTHHLGREPRAGTQLHWSPPTVQRVLDTSLAWAVRNGHFEISDFLLQHGADINTRWSSHEPASLLHELVFSEFGENYAAMQFLIDRGIDMTIEDYRWGGTAQGWAYHAAGNEKMAQWLGEAERKRQNGSR
jgi:hypothetical protein